MEKLLDIEKKFIENLFKPKQKYKGISGAFLVLLESLMSRI
jgi:hypothetical protein